MKLHAPATLRNREAIAAVLERELPDSGIVLEIASGSGEHAAFFAERFPRHKWQPSDADEEAAASIAAYRAEYGRENLLSPVLLDASRPENWPAISADAILCVNMVHISPWSATEGLFAGAQSILSSEAPLILYGPYIEDDVETVQSNLDFDISLRGRDPSWGLRGVADMDTLAKANGFVRTARHAMPANNIMLVYRTQA